MTPQREYLETREICSFYLRIFKASDGYEVDIYWYKDFIETANCKGNDNEFNEFMRSLRNIIMEGTYRRQLEGDSNLHPIFKQALKPFGIK
jgi:hypothetical protein